MNRTEEQIAAMAEHLDGQANIRMINKLLREQDDSDLWPILNEYNVTDRAIRHIQKWQRDSGIALYGLEYCYAVELEISRMVNAE